MYLESLDNFSGKTVYSVICPLVDWYLFLFGCYQFFQVGAAQCFSFASTFLHAS